MLYSAPPLEPKILKPVALFWSVLSHAVVLAPIEADRRLEREHERVAGNSAVDVVAGHGATPSRRLAAVQSVRVPSSVTLPMTGAGPRR